MSFFRKLIFAVFILLVILPAIFGASATGLIRGSVSDPLGARIPAATVTLTSDGLPINTTTTDANGNFSFPDVNTGHYQIEVTVPGFSPYKNTEVVVGNGATTALAILLQVGVLKQDVVVTATGSETPVAQIGSSVSLIGSEEIQAQNKLDVLEDLRQIPGIQIVQTSERGGTASMFVRGGESSFNKILIDGVPSNFIGGYFDFGQLANSGVESVEILRGSDSVLYGADALAAVVNITTPRGRTSQPELKYSVDGGNFKTYRQSVSLGGVFRKFDYFSDFTRFDTQGSYTNDFFHNASYSGNFGFVPSATTDLRATVKHTVAGVGAPNGIYLYGVSDDSAEKNQNTYLSGTMQNQTTSRWHNLLRFGYAQLNEVYTNPTATGQMDSYGDYLGNRVTIQGANGYQVTGQGILDYYGTYPAVHTTYNARRSLYGQSDYRFAGDWTGTFGFRYEHEDGSGFTRNNYSYVMETHGSIGRRLYLTGGTGVENNAVFGVAVSPRVSGAYYLRRPSTGAFLTETKIRASFGKGIEEPSTGQQASELFALLTPSQRSQFSVDPIGPQRSRTSDVGIDQGLWGGRARVEGTFFYNQFYDLITYLSSTAMVSIGVNPGAATALGGSGAYVNAGSTSSKGLETQVITSLGHGLRVQANYTYLDAIVTKSFGSPVYNPQFPGIAIGAFAALQGQRPFRRAPHSGSVSLLYSARKFTGTVTGSIVGKRDDSTFLYDAFYGNSLLLPNRNLAAAYQKIDLSGRYTIKPAVSIYTSVENLFSQHYQPAFGFPAAPFTIRSGVTVTLSGETWRK